MALVVYDIESTVLYPEMCNVLRSVSQGAYLCRHSGCGRTWMLTRVHLESSMMLTEDERHPTNRSHLAPPYPRSGAQGKSFPFTRGNLGETVPSGGAGKMISTHAIIASTVGVKTPSATVPGIEKGLAEW